MLSEISISPSPHISLPLSTRRVMGDVTIGLLFPMIAAVYYFRLDAIRLTLVCIVSCMATEFICNLMRRKPAPAQSLGDLSALVTGIILAFSIPPAFPWWGAVIGSAFAIAIGKMVFGGLGSNIFNPAMAGRAFLTASFGVMMTTWSLPATWNPEMPAIGTPDAVIVNSGREQAYGDAITQATPLDWSGRAVKGQVNAKELDKQIMPSFLGEIGGCLGETSTVMLLIGGLYLLIRKTITFHIPLAVLLSAFIFASILWLIDADKYMSPLMHLTSGGLLICAFFIATDPVTAPLTVKGMWIFGIGVGTLTMLIRVFGGYPGGVMYSVLLMNSLTPLIDRLCKLTPSGGKPNA